MITSNIRKIMENKGVTIRNMVEQTGLADKTILRARCEQINQCRVYTLETIADFLDCKVKDLFDEAD
jgi:DNA-binding Xre family transcriptional regulator